MYAPLLCNTALSPRACAADVATTAAPPAVAATPRTTALWLGAYEQITVADDTGGPIAVAVAAAAVAQPPLANTTNAT